MSVKGNQTVLLIKNDSSLLLKVFLNYFIYNFLRNVYLEIYPRRTDTIVIERRVSINSIRRFFMLECLRNH
jgi:hypothetical protein